MNSVVTEGGYNPPSVPNILPSGLIGCFIHRTVPAMAIFVPHMSRQVLQHLSGPMWAGGRAPFGHADLVLVPDTLVGFRAVASLGLCAACATDIYLAYSQTKSSTLPMVAIGQEVFTGDVDHRMIATSTPQDDHGVDMKFTAPLVRNMDIGNQRRLSVFAADLVDALVWVPFKIEVHSR
jgi:hypothetical protein